MHREVLLEIALSVKSLQDHKCKITTFIAGKYYQGAGGGAAQD